MVATHTELSATEITTRLKAQTFCKTCWWRNRIASSKILFIVHHFDWACLQAIDRPTDTRAQRAGGKLRNRSPVREQPSVDVVSR